MTDPNRNPLRKQESKSSLEKSLQMLSPPQQAPITIYPGPSAGLAALSKADIEIAERLHNLRKSQHQDLPTQEEMETRLAHLKGLPPDHYSRQCHHPPPDTRTDTQKTEDLVARAMQEVSMEARLPSATDELEARLARLRGEEPQPRGAAALPPHTHSAYTMPTPGLPDDTLGDDLDNMSLDEVEALMKAVEKDDEAAGAGAERAMEELQGDPELVGAMAEATRRKDKEKPHQHKSSKASSRKKKGSSCSEDEERHSKSFYSDIDIEMEGGKAIDAVTEQEEVQRIIDMYTKRAELKKERKRKKKEAAAAAAAAAAEGGGGGAAAAEGGVAGGGPGVEGEGEDSDSDIEVSSDSDLSLESDKYSTSEELSD